MLHGSMHTTFTLPQLQWKEAVHTLPISDISKDVLQRALNRLLTRNNNLTPLTEAEAAQFEREVMFLWLTNGTNGTKRKGYIVGWRKISRQERLLCLEFDGYDMKAPRECPVPVIELEAFKLSTDNDAGLEELIRSL
ncbi:MAG: hypothetical protein Q7R88_03220 [bacterium]|nr:hypothetical protein [bacterium]